jgi:hypothetical protein
LTRLWSDFFQSYFCSAEIEGRAKKGEKRNQKKTFPAKIFVFSVLEQILIKLHSQKNLELQKTETALGKIKK